MRVLTVNERAYYINLGLLASMSELGHSVETLPLGCYAQREQRHLLTSYLHGFRPDFVLTPGWSIGIFDTEMFLDTMHHSTVPHVYWATEDPLFFHEVSMVFAPRSTYVFTTAEECVPLYRGMGRASSTLMFGCNPNLFRPMPPQPQYCHDIALVANNYTWFSADKGFRRKAVRDIVVPLVDAGYDLKIWGAGWDGSDGEVSVGEHWAGYIDYLQTPSIYSSAKIVLGLQSVNTSSTQTSCRTFEIMGCGAFYLTCHTPSHEALFDNHRHLVWSRSPEETLELVDYYLSHDAERRAIAAQGRAEVLQKHTYNARVATLLTDLLPHLGLSWPAAAQPEDGRIESWPRRFS